MKKIYRWKFLRAGLKSKNGNLKWKKGKWNKITGHLIMCQVGFHCSKKPYDAFSFVQGEILARVECRGKHLAGKDKECWSEQRVVKAYKWTKKDSVKLAIYSAKLVLPIFEKQYPNDKRPRQAIEAAVKWLKNPTKKNKVAAAVAAEAAGTASWAAVAAEAAGTASWAAGAAWAVRAASWAAVAAVAAGTASWAAGAAWAVRATEAAWAVRATEAAAIKKIQRYFNKLVKNLKPL